MGRDFNSSDKDKVERKAIEDALEGKYDPERAQDDFWYTHKKVEAEKVYKDAFYRARGSEPPKKT